MKKTLLCLLSAVWFVVSPVQAETESPRAICTAEADDAGFENASEKDAYINDCIQQITQEDGEMGEQKSEDRPVNEEG